jgi:hypothetical protein
MGVAAGRWAEDCVAHSASVAMPMTEATNIDEAIRSILKVHTPATQGRPNEGFCEPSVVLRQ